MLDFFSSYSFNSFEWTVMLVMISSFLHVPEESLVEGGRGVHCSPQEWSSPSHLPQHKPHTHHHPPTPHPRRRWMRVMNTDVLIQGESGCRSFIGGLRSWADWELRISFFFFTIKAFPPLINSYNGQKVWFFFFQTFKLPFNHVLLSAGTENRVWVITMWPSLPRPRLQSGLLLINVRHNSDTQR